MCSWIRFWREIQKFKSCRIWSCFLRNFIVAKKSKNVEIVFSIPKAKSGSISIKIRQPLFWTDPYLPDLFHIHLLKTQMVKSENEFQPNMDTNTSEKWANSSFKRAICREEFSSRSFQWFLCSAKCVMY